MIELRSRVYRSFLVERMEVEEGGLGAERRMRKKILYWNFQYLCPLMAPRLCCSMR
jgi:hypothetical protein